MQLAGRNGGWVWPKLTDEGWYPEVRVIKPPHINVSMSTKRRTVYTFEQL